jgi:branched-chain amino acid transport system permease protein
MSMSLFVIQTLNSLAFGGLLFLLASGFSLIFGLLRIPNLAHGALFMVGAYIGYSALNAGLPFWMACMVSAVCVALLGVVIERGVLARLAGNELAQVLATLGITFIIADLCLIIWGGDPMQLAAPEWLSGSFRVLDFVFPKYRVAVVVAALVSALLLWLLIEKTRLGAMIRAGVDDREMARAIGIPVKRLGTLVFALGTALVAVAGVLGGPMLGVYPGLDMEMLPLSLVVVVLGGIGSLTGALVGSFIIAFIYNFGQALFPDLAYVILFLPMVVILAVRPRGLFGRA